MKDILLGISVFVSIFLICFSVKTFAQGPLPKKVQAAQVAPSPSPAQEIKSTVIAPPQDTDQALSLIGVLLSFWKNGQYLLAGGVITLIACFAINRWGLPAIGLGSALTPLLSAVIGVISGVGLAVAHGAPLTAAVLAVMSGPLAGHAWELALQFFFPKKPSL